MSQEELAKAVGLSRSSLAQIELGNRNVTAMELAAFADQLNFSLDEIMSNDFKYEKTYTNNETDEVSEIRISVPEFKVNEFKNLILYSHEKCAGKPNVGETVLNKLLYFSDFNYYEIYEEHLSGATYRKFAKGPVPKEISDILKEMIQEGKLQGFDVKYFGYSQRRYFPLIAADRKLFNGAELEVVDKVIDQLSGMSATEISNYSHGDMPWKASSDRQVIDYELVFYREAPYSVRTYNE
jgi:transcriptional regulator with XRE-family HTH domain